MHRCLTIASWLFIAIGHLAFVKCNAMSEMLSLRNELIDPPNTEYRFVPQWPSLDVLDKVNTVSGVDICANGYPWIFHRAGRSWEENDFDSENRYTKIRKGPIRRHTILKLNNKIAGSTINKSFGKNQFYLPHGIFAGNGFLLVTDVARHQVLKIDMNTQEVLMTIGEKFVPGSDKKHFCKPTQAIAAANGDIFVADGYCNSRIVKFDKNGIFLAQWGRPNPPDDNDPPLERNLHLPHSLALIEKRDIICVADRENLRVQCYRAGLKNNSTAGQYLFTIAEIDFGRVYSISYDKINDALLILGGKQKFIDTSKVFVFSFADGKFLDTVTFPGVEGFGMGHSIATSPSGRYFIVGGLTRECPGDPSVCGLYRDNEAMRARNLWLYARF